MKKTLIISTIVVLFTLYINLNFIWDDGNGGLSDFGWFLGGMLFYLFLVFTQVPLLVSLKEKFHLKKGVLLSINVLCLIFVFLYPLGIYRPLEKRTPFLIAFNEGVVNCTTTLSLFKNREFKEVNICFGKTTTRGKYKIKKDTVLFEVETLGKNVKQFYKYAIIDKNNMELNRYYENDSMKTGKLYIKELSDDLNNLKD